MLKRTSTAVWRGTGVDGKGLLTTQSGTFRDQPYSFQTRFVSEDGKAGTNPEELIAAAHAGCFAMALGLALSAAGHPPTELRAKSTVAIDKEGAGFAIKNIALDLEAKVPGIDDAKFRTLADDAKKNCPVSKALAAVEISLSAKLLS
jgi:osmotically inducible protein OsmC